MTPFVGRGREIARLRAGLVAGENFVVSGVFGIGRTSLVRAVAASMADHHRFIVLDLQGTPLSVARELHEALFRGEVTVRSFRSLRYRIATRALTDRRNHVVVLDNVSRLTAPKLDFIRRLVEARRYRVVAIVEAFLGGKELLHLRSALRCGPPIRLGPLSVADSERFLEASARALGLAWRSAEVHGLAVASHGFPLGMRELVDRSLARDAAASPGSFERPYRPRRT